MARSVAVLVVFALTGACSRDSDRRAVPGATPIGNSAVSHLVFLTRDACVNTATMRTRLDEALVVLGQPVAYEVLNQGTLPTSDMRLGYPTPTLLYGGRDLLGMTEPTPPFEGPT